jgi:hypothetical protein
MFPRMSYASITKLNYAIILEGGEKLGYGHFRVWSIENKNQYPPRPGLKMIWILRPVKARL